MRRYLLRGDFAYFSSLLDFAHRSRLHSYYTHARYAEAQGLRYTSRMPSFSIAAAHFFLPPA